MCWVSCWFVCVVLRFAMCLVCVIVVLKCWAMRCFVVYAFRLSFVAQRLLRVACCLVFGGRCLSCVVYVVCFGVACVLFLVSRLLVFGVDWMWFVVWCVGVCRSVFIVC